MTLDEYFNGKEKPRKLFESVRRVMESMGTMEIRVTKSGIAFRRRKAFAWVWMPGKYLRGKSAPLVLTIALHHKDLSARWKQVVEPYPDRFIHHLELHSAKDIDQEVRNWLLDAWTTAA